MLMTRHFDLPACCLRDSPVVVNLFLLAPRAQRSTLFPYTTLFRSHSKYETVTPPAFVRTSGNTGIPRCRTSSQDRKSTRLNSSHTVISYAVFCLKKKTRKRARNRSTRRRALLQTVSRQ